MNEVDSLITDHKLEQASVACQRYGNPLSRVYVTAIRLAGRSRDQIKAVVEETGSREVASLERYLGLLGTIATITPLLGLLGTVIGMVQAFSILGATGQADPAQLIGRVEAHALQAIHPHDLLVDAVFVRRAHDMTENARNGIRQARRGWRLFGRRKPAQTAR